MNGQTLYSIKSLFKLELNARFADLNIKSTKGIIKLVLVLAFLGVFIWLYVKLAGRMIVDFKDYGYGPLFLKMFLCLLGVGLTISGITTIEKNLFLSGNNELLLKYPVKPTDVFVAKVLLQFIIYLSYCIIAFTPIFITYGVKTQQNAGFYFLIPLVVILATFFIFLTSTLLSVPFMRVKAYVRDRYVLTLFISIIVVAGCFAIYLMAVQKIMLFMQTNNLAFFDGTIVTVIGNICSYIVPFSHLSRLLILDKPWLCLFISILAVALVGVLTYVVIKKEYLNSIYISVEKEGCSFEKGSRFVAEGNFLALLKKDFYEILRSVNYSFQYLAMSLAAPVMTYFCTALAMSMSDNAIGTDSALVAPLAMLVILIFVTIMVSFSATSISRSGDAFYMTKVSPIPYKIQVLVKFALYMIVSVAVIVTSVVVLLVFKVDGKHILDIASAAKMLVILLLIAVGETCMSIKMDIMRPNFPVGDGDELQGGTTNTFISMLVGFVVAMFIGVIGMAGSLILNPTALFSSVKLQELFPSGQAIMYLFFGIISFIYCLAMCLWLFVGLEKSYAKITPLR